MTVFFLIHACFLDNGQLLQKLEHVGVIGISLQWFSDYLKSRNLMTAVDASVSTVRPVLSRVPQGSVLGQLLSVIFFLDLPKSALSTCVQFADDTSVDEANCRGHEHCVLPADTGKLSAWAGDWNSNFNASKSVQLQISYRRRISKLHALSLDSSEIPSVDKTKHMGVVINHRICWSDHIQWLRQRTLYKVYLLRMLAFRYGSIELVDKLFKTLLLPSLVYAASVSDSCSKAESESQKNFSSLLFVPFSATAKSIL